MYGKQTISERSFLGTERKNKTKQTNEKDLELKSFYRQKQIYK